MSLRGYHYAMGGKKVSNATFEIFWKKVSNAGFERF